MTVNNEMTWVEHLTELRSRILWVFVFFVIALIGGLFVAGPLIRYLQTNPIIHIDTKLTSFSPSDTLAVYMKFAFVIGFVITLPYALYHLWRFVGPGLRPSEKRVSLYFIPVAFVLFLIGLLFGFYIVFPMVMIFLTNFNLEMGVPILYGINQYFDFMSNMVIPFGFLFEMPILVIFLTKIRILNPHRLGKMRRLAYFVLAVVSVTITPPDIMSDIIVMVPLLLLYEFSVWLSKVVHRRQLKQDEEWEKEFSQEWENSEANGV